MLKTTCAILIVCSALCAQSAPAAKKVELNAKSFFPPEYSYESFVDLEALRKTDLWTQLQGSSKKFESMREDFRKEFGVKLQDVNQVRGVRDFSLAPVSEDETEEGLAEGVLPLPEVMVFSGAKELQLPDLSERVITRDGAGAWRRYRKTTRQAGELAGHEVVMENAMHFVRTPGNVESGVARKLFVLPNPKLLVYGNHDLVAPVLLGERRGGVPGPDLLVLLAGKKTLAYLAASFPKGPIRDQCLEPFSKDMFPAEDPLTGFLLSLHVDPANKHVILRGTFRFKTGKLGPAMARKSLPKKINELAGIPQGASQHYTNAKVEFDKMMEKIQCQQQGAEFLMTLDLGTAKQLEEWLEEWLESILLLDLERRLQDLLRKR